MVKICRRRYEMKNFWIRTFQSFPHHPKYIFYDVRSSNPRIDISNGKEFNICRCPCASKAIFGLQSQNDVAQRPIHRTGHQIEWVMVTNSNLFGKKRSIWKMYLKEKMYWRQRNKKKMNNTKKYRDLYKFAELLVIPSFTFFLSFLHSFRDKISNLWCFTWI